MTEYKSIEYCVNQVIAEITRRDVEQVSEILHALGWEEVVRCRDCKHMHTVRSWLGMDVDECWLHADPETGALGKEPTEPYGFCAWGVRKDDA